MDLQSSTVIKKPGMDPIRFEDWMYQASEDMGEEGLIDFDVEEAQLEKTKQEQQAEIITALQEKLRKTESPDDARKTLNKVIMKNWRAFCTNDAQRSVSNL